MQKLPLALIGCIISMATFSQSKCKYDHDKYDKMEQQRIVWNEEKVGGGIGSKWWFKLADFGGTKIILLTVRFGTRSGVVVGTNDPLKLKFTDSDSIYNAYTKQITTSYMYQHICDEIQVFYYLDAATVEKLATSNLDNVRIYYNDTYRDANIKNGEAERIQKSANCVYKQL